MTGGRPRRAVAAVRAGSALALSVLAVAVVAVSVLAALGGAASACGPDTPCRVDGGEYRIVLPAGTPKPENGWPAVVFFHGWGSSAANVAGNRSLAGAFADLGYAVVAPDGVVPPGGRNSAWAIPGLPDTGRDDPVFVEAVLADAIRRFGLDGERLVASGFSLGGSFVWHLACHRPAPFQAFLPVAGAFWEPLPVACAGSVDLWHLHGFADAVVPLEGRPVAEGRYVQGDVFAGLERLRRANGCESDGPSAFSGEAESGLICRHWPAERCGGAASLAFCLHPGGHTLPAGWVDAALDWLETGR